MEIRIGVTQAPRELTIDVADDDAEEVSAAIEGALAGATDVLWVTDRRGRRLAVPAAKIAYVELGAADGGRRIGFGG